MQEKRPQGVGLNNAHCLNWVLAGMQAQADVLCAEEGRCDESTSRSYATAPRTSAEPLDAESLRVGLRGLHALQVAASADVSALKEGRCDTSTSDAAPRTLAPLLDAERLEMGLSASVRTRELSLAQLRRSTEALSLLTRASTEVTQTMQRLLDAVHTRAIKLGCDLRLKPFTITVAGLAEHVLGVVDALCELCEKSSEAARRAEVKASTMQVQLDATERQRRRQVEETTAARDAEAAARSKLAAVQAQMHAMTAVCASVGTAQAVANQEGAAATVAAPPPPPPPPPPPDAMPGDDEAKNRRIRELEANARQAYQAVEELAGNIGAQRMEMEARIAEAELHAIKWRKEAHEANEKFEKSNRRAMELSLKLKASGESAAESVAKAKSREAAWDNDMRVLKVKVANQRNEARKLKRQLATVRADAAAAAGAAEARLASAMAERREVETVKEALVARLRKLEVEAQQCFVQMEAMQLQVAARDDPSTRGQPVRSIHGALELAMRARVKPHTPKRTNTHVRFVHEDAESPAPDSSPPGGSAYELVIAQQAT